MLEKRLYLYNVVPEYCDYLRRYDRKVPYNAGNKEKRPFIGIVLKINNHNYYAPLTSPKEKHRKMKNSPDFHKINGGIWGAINFNNMIPIQQDNLTLAEMDIKKNDTDEMIAYKNLMKNQWLWCNENIDVITKKAEKLHALVCDKEKRENPVIQRCCNYSLLEEKCLEYSQKKKKPLNQAMKDAAERTEKKEKTNVIDHGHDGR